MLNLLANLISSEGALEVRRGLGHFLDSITTLEVKESLSSEVSCLLSSSLSLVVVTITTEEDRTQGKVDKKVKLLVILVFSLIFETDV